MRTVAVVAGPCVKVAPAPAPGRVKVTETPSIGCLSALVTSAVSDCEKLAPAATCCPSPLTTAMSVGRLSHSSVTRPSQSAEAPSGHAQARSLAPMLSTVTPGAV